MQLRILGCYSATPHPDKNPTAQLLEIKGHHFLIDCGEGTQVQLRKYKVKFAHIKHIFISHLHGDHFYGLPGLISSFRLLGREAPLHVYGPKGIKAAVTLLLKLADSWTNYPLHFHELTSKTSEIIFENEKLSVSTIPLKHRVYTNGFLFKEKTNLRKLNKTAIDHYRVDRSQFQNLKLGLDAENVKGELIKNTLLTIAPPLPKSYAYCSDTSYQPEMIPIIKGVDKLYHESTFLDDHEVLAQKTQHSTASQAAQIAHQAKAGELILGHYSSRYKELQEFKIQAENFFNPVLLAHDGDLIIWD